MNRRGVVNVLLLTAFAILFLGSLLAAVAAYAGYHSVALEPDRAFGIQVSDTRIVENHSFWPSVTVEGEIAPGVVETKTVTAHWLLMSPLLVIALALVVAAWPSRRHDVPRTGAALDDTQPMPATRGA